jgi:hypothetical protein
MGMKPEKDVCLEKSSVAYTVRPWRHLAAPTRRGEYPVVVGV